MKKLGIVFGILAVAALTGSTYGMKITNVTNEEVVFNCSYENGTPGENVQIDTPEIGTFYFGEWGGAPATLQDTQEHHWIEDATTNPDGITPYYGNNAHRVEIGTTVRPYAHAIPVGTAAADGDVIKVEFALMSISEWPVIGLREELPSDYTATPPYPKSLGNLIFTGPDYSAAWGAGWEDVGSVFTQAAGYEVWLNAHNAGEWNEVVLEYTCGSANLDVTVNGVGHTFTNLNPGILNYVAFGSPYNNSHGYIDAIPEPATLSLLALGGLALIRRKR